MTGCQAFSNTELCLDNVQKVVLNNSISLFKIQGNELMLGMWSGTFLGVSPSLVLLSLSFQLQGYIYKLVY